MAAETTTVQIVISLAVDGSRADVERYRNALQALADAMLVQAEDGLWSLGYVDAESEDAPNERLADISNAHVRAVRIQGTDELI